MLGPRALAAAFLLGILAAKAFAAAAPTDIQVSVDKFNEHLHVRATMHVDAQPPEVWRVLVDYDNAPKFISDLKESRVVQRNGNTLRVFQRSHVQLGPLSIPIESTRDVKLFEPQRIESHVVGGTLQQADAVTELAAEPGGTRLNYRSDIVSSNFVPTEMLKKEAEQRFAQLRAEVMRRKQQGGTR
jgi:uncharacterized membrane protein